MIPVDRRQSPRAQEALRMVVYLSFSNWNFFFSCYWKQANLTTEANCVYVFIWLLRSKNGPAARVSLSDIVLFGLTHWFTQDGVFASLFKYMHDLWSNSEQKSDRLVKQNKVKCSKGDFINPYLIAVSDIQWSWWLIWIL